MVIYKSYIPVLFVLLVLFTFIPTRSFATTGYCPKTIPMSGTCVAPEYATWTNWPTTWTYNASANTCTKQRTRTDTYFASRYVYWEVWGMLHPITQDKGCIDEEWELCHVIPPLNPPVKGATGISYVCDIPYNWEVFTVTDSYPFCTAGSPETQTSTRPTITKNSLTTTVYVGDTISDTATGTDPEGGTVTNKIQTSFNTSNYQRISGQLVYKFTAPGTYTVTYSLADTYYDAVYTNCGLLAPGRERTFTVLPKDYNWDWSSCGSWTPDPCTGGTQTGSRSVWCELSGSQNGTYNGTTVADSYCISAVGAKPTTVCSRDCPVCTNGPYVWYTSAWSPTTCSSGITQTRSVWCKDNSGQSAQDQCCTGTKPSSTYVCPVDPCSGLSNVCIGTKNACSTYAQASCNSTSAPGCTWTSSAVCTGTASACSTYGTSSACTTPAKGCSWTAGSSYCAGTLSYWYSNCSYFKRYQCAYPSDCARNDCKFGGIGCYLVSSSENCDAKVMAACSARYNQDFCNAGEGCSWTTNYSCTGTVSACSTYNQTNCPSVTGCTWTTTSSCTGTATACSARTQTQCNLSGSGCTWCPGTNTAPVISPATDQSVCLSTVIADITTASDAEDGNLTSSIVTNSPSGIVKNSQLNYYFTTVGAKVMTYNVTDSGSLAATQKSRTVTVGYCGAWASGTWGTCSGVPATQTRTVTCMLSGSPVADSYCDPATKPATSQSCDSIPVISPQSTVNTYVYTWVNDATTATDTEDGNLTSSIETGALTNMVRETDLRYYFTQDGTYVVTYDVIDSNSNSAVQKTSIVNVGYQAAWDLGDWGTCDENNQRTRTVTCMLFGSPVADEYCEPPKPDLTGACVETSFECTSDNIHWNDCSKTFFLASPRSKICTRQIDPIGATSWNWSIPTNILDNDSPQMKVADTDSATAQDTCFDFEGQFVSPEIQRVLRLDIGSSGEGGAVEKTIKVKLVNPKIQEA